MTDEDTVRKLVCDYEAGMFAHREFRCRLTECVTFENVDGIVSQLPLYVLSMLEDEIGNAPVTDDGWSTMRVFESHCGPEPVEDMQRRHAEKLAKYRAGIETLRRWFKQK